ncbi:helix-turn-helix domain-containing protein [Paludibacter sp.]
MLYVKHFDNNKSNEWLVRKFEIFFNESFLAEKFIPRPDISIVFHFKDRPLILGETNIQLEPFFAAPIIPQSIILNFHGTMDTFIVICKAAVFSRVFGIDLSPIQKKSINLPHEIFYPLWKDLSEIETTNKRIEHFTNFTNSFQKTLYIPDVIDMFYEKIIEKSPATLLKDIIGECAACQRTLERYFVKRTGVSPKTLMRIVRIDYLWTKIKDEKAINYQDLVFDGNYFDQAHFIKDFKSIIGEKPSYFFNRNLQITKMFSGKMEGQL